MKFTTALVTLLAAAASLVQCVAADANPITIKSYKFYDSVTGKYFGVRGTCDHEATPCEFVRMPNFDFLAKEYNATNYEDEPDMDSFEASGSKQEFPSCPSSFPSLSDVEWAADSSASLECPEPIEAPLCASGSLVQCVAADANPITIKSYKFYDSVTGKYFGVRGTCDHEATPCEFVRMPNFDFLAKEYNATNYVDESDMNAFKPSRSKQEFPACPPSFADSTTDDTMKLPKALSILCAAILTTIQPTLAITNPITIKSYKFYDSVTGKYFGVRGVDYYPRPNAGELNVNNYDFFTEEFEHVWGPDLDHLAELGANAVRIYAVDPSKSHDKFMCALRSRGMYLLLDLGASCENCSISKAKYPECYPPELKARGEQIISVFSKYDNLMAFSAGNEVNHVVKDPEDNAPCQKKFIRDMRAYIAGCPSMREIPVGVVLADTNRDVNALYYNCRTDPDDEYENAQWYGLNVYLHCDGTQTDAAEVGPGFQKLLDDFTSYKMNIPVMLTEFGCLDPSFPTMGDYKAQRTWIQTTWLHSKEFREEFNGGFIFEYSTELANSQPQSLYPFTDFGPQNYGLGYYSPETCDHQATPCEFVRMPNFDYLAKEHNATNYDDEPEMSAFEPSASKLSFPACPSTFANLKDVEWAADSSPSLQCPDPAVVVTCPADSGGSIVRSNVTKKPTKAPTKAPTRRPDSVKSSSAGSKAATGKTDTAKSPEPASPSDQPRSVANYKFYDSVTGKYFGVRGVDYYPRPNAGELDVNNHDFFTDDHEHIWGPDVSYLAAVGANAVRLYAVDPSKSHHKFMCALRSHGMYAMIDLGANCKDCAITKDKYPACYPDDLKKRGEQIISVFAKYDNVMAFSAGNEVNHVVVDPKDNAPCQKKFIRDMRAFISKCSTIRDIPVGVVLADTDRQANALYYNCRTNSSDTMENAEWYGLNVYLHCDGKVTDVANAAGFQKLLSDFKSYKMNIPVMLTEFGCLNPSFPTIDGYEAQRTWLQAGWLHSTAFRAEFSGGFVFEYSTENANSKKDSPYPFTKYGEQNYGLGYFSPETCDHATTKCEFKPMPNYGFLAKEYNATKYDDEPLMSAFTPNADKRAKHGMP
ncbi:hypothetical protein P43SY_002663 [Pythium insidiosum]|uniref:Glycoside hydrolase n=1 Tax=Pythium insidiosum TaxID=114742 RepID=A0AAD5MAA4_PYTIN|nr:hypothetical protein P43SY_002663 [Pythium insidiosum]